MGLLKSAATKLLDRSDGVSWDFLDNASARSRFSNYLPWHAYDPKTKVYINEDETAGFLWECSPAAFAGDKAATTLNGLFRLDLPSGSVIQFILHSDSYIDPILKAHMGLKTRSDDIAQNAARSYCQFLKAGVDGLWNLGGIPLRNFRLVVCLKMPIGDKTTVSPSDIHERVGEVLNGAGLGAEPMEPPALLAWMRRILNDTEIPNDQAYDPDMPIRAQVVLGETEIKGEWSEVSIGEKIFRPITPKVFPQSVSLWQTNLIFGGVWGLQSDSDQAKTEFLYSLNIVFDDGVSNSIRAKGGLILKQKAAGTFAPTLIEKQQEFSGAIRDLNDGKRFVRIIPTLWVWGRERKIVGESLARMKRMWEGQGYVMQEDKGIVSLLFLSSLPFGLYNVGRNVENLDRDFIVRADTVSPILPIQSDFAGFGAPQLMFVGRKGQVCTLDLFDKRANNHNCYVAAASGSGKSVLINSIVQNYYGAGAKIRMVDIGGSYKKTAKMLGGTYLEFTEDSNVCLNPFSTIIEIEEDLSVVAAVILQMIFSTTDNVPHDSAESAYNLVRKAVRWAYEKYKNDANIDAVHAFLQTFPHHMAKKEDRDAIGEVEKLRHLARELSFNLLEFTSNGVYGRWFNGKSTLDIANQDFVVLELEHLKPKRELFKVVTLQVINMVTQDLYLSDRNDRRLIIFDEAWQFLQDANILEKVIEEGYRRARKYGGSFTIVTQSVLDLKLFGGVGNVINASSAFKCLLESPDYDKAVQEKILQYEGFVMDLLKSTKSNRPKYSEIFVDTPAGQGVVRLALDPVSYYLYTSDAKENAEIESLVAGGMTYMEAINEMVRRYRS